MRVFDYISAIFLSLYALAMTFLLLFIVGWDNKGASDWWNKSSADWLFAAIVGLVVFAAWRSAYASYMGDPIGKWLRVTLILVLFGHSYFTIWLAQGEAKLYFGLPCIALLIGVLSLLSKNRLRTLTS